MLCRSPSFFCVLLSILVVNVHCDPETVRQTTNGPVKGVEKTSSLGQKYYAFLGVPYAEPPITGRDPYTGEEVDRRFKAPEPLKRKWTEILNVHSFGDFCIPSISQNLSSTARTTSEDCLFVNIYVPVGGAEKKTVLIWIHGGGFSMGNTDDSKHGPDFLLFEDNIVITVQYRIGIFGFLNLGTEQYSGNMGLKDQQLAIKWVFENIEHFSGKKDEILLFGASAGGASVNFHMLNEESRKYFNRAFALSSSALCSYALMEANHVERMHKCSKINDEAKLTEYLKTVDIDALVKCYEYQIEKAEGLTLTPPWAPTIENPRAVRAFITKTPDELYSPHNAPTMDAMFSFNSAEMVKFSPDLLQRTEPLIKKDWKDPKLYLPFTGFNETSHPLEYQQVFKRIRQAYFSNSTIGDGIKRENIGLVSDLNFCDSILKATILQSNANNNDSDETKHKNTFLFRFSVDADLNLIKIGSGLNYDGAAHGDYLCYIFHCHKFDKFKVYDRHLENKDKSYYAIMRMVKMITNFARSGNPSIEGDTPFQSCKSPTEVYCQEISNNVKSSVTNDIKEQLHYYMWREVEVIYRNLTNVSHGREITTANTANALQIKQLMMCIFVSIFLVSFADVNAIRRFV